MSRVQRSSGIIATGSYVPEKVLSNFYFEQILDTDDAWIKARTGIEERRIADDNTATSDISTKAALEALGKSGLSAEDLDMIIVATITPDMLFPATACIVQKNIGAVNAAAFDIEVACSGFLYALTIADQFIKTGFYKNILVIGAETISKILDYTDRNTCLLFGDGAGAAIVSAVEEGYGILSSHLGSDGEGGHLLNCPGGGSRNPTSLKSIEDRLHYLKMDGGEVFKFAIKIFGEATEKVLEKSGLKIADVDHIIPHQANIRILDSSAKRLKISREKIFSNVNKYGNTSAASIAIALDEANKQQLLKDDDVIVFVAFGAGLTWASMVMKWKNVRG